MKASQLQVLYEDNHLIAVNKPPGMLVQGDKTGDETLADVVKAYIKEKYNKPGDVYLGIAHRIDRPVSGIVLFARTSKALVRVNEMFQNKTIEKTYWAVVQKTPEKLKGTLVNYIVKNQEKNRSKKVNKPRKGALLSELDYELIGSINHYHLLRVHPKTGRHHQIRVQLAAMGCPIKGDIKYGFKRGNENKSIHLHAQGMSLIHPVKKEPITITAKVPKDIVWNSFNT